MTNNPIFSFFKSTQLLRYRRDNGLYVLNFKKINIIEIKRKKVIFDFSDASLVHYGDILFFIPLLIFLAENINIKVEVLVDPNRLSFVKYLTAGSENIVVCQESLEHNSFDDLLIVTSAYSIFNHLNTSACIVGLGHLNKAVEIKYPIFFAITFLNNFANLGVSLNDVITTTKEWQENITSRLISEADSSLVHIPNSGCFLCPYLASGRFRDFFGVNQKKIINFAVNLMKKNQGSIYIIGGKNDELVRLNDYSHFYDYRGHDLLNVMKAACSEKIVQGVGFDNFWMHFFDLIGKPYFVKFRGRFSKLGKSIHMNSVNVSFNYHTEKLYIK